MEKETQQFIAQVVYAIPAMDELRRRFPTRVDPAYEGISFKHIKACENVSRETREVTFELVHLGHDASNDAVLTELDKRKLRPALPEELLAFDAMYPGEMAKFPIGALGSETRVDGDHYVACLWGGVVNGRDLGLHYSGCGWNNLYRFLAVRE